MEMYPDQEEQAAAGRRKIRIPWLALAVLSWLSAGPVCIAVVEMATHHLLTVRAQAFIELAVKKRKILRYRSWGKAKDCDKS